MVEIKLIRDSDSQIAIIFGPIIQQVPHFIFLSIGRKSNDNTKLSFLFNILLFIVFSIINIFMRNS